jgi:hypothetical protein
MMMFPNYLAISGKLALGKRYEVYPASTFNASLCAAYNLTGLMNAQFPGAASLTTSMLISAGTQYAFVAGPNCAVIDRNGIVNVSSSNCARSLPTICEKSLWIGGQSVSVDHDYLNFLIICAIVQFCSGQLNIHTVLQLPNSSNLRYWCRFLQSPRDADCGHD